MCHFMLQNERIDGKQCLAMLGYPARLHQVRRQCSNIRRLKCDFQERTCDLVTMHDASHRGMLSVHIIHTPAVYHIMYTNDGIPMFTGHRPTEPWYSALLNCHAPPHIQGKHSFEVLVPKLLQDRQLGIRDAHWGLYISIIIRQTHAEGRITKPRHVFNVTVAVGIVDLAKCR